MSKLAITRRIHLLPGREEDGIRWLCETASVRAQAGQLSQLILRGQIDPHEYQLVQIWVDDRTYAAWQEVDPPNDRQLRHRPLACRAAQPVYDPRPALRKQPSRPIMNATDHRGMEPKP